MWKSKEPQQRPSPLQSLGNLVKDLLLEAQRNAVSSSHLQRMVKNGLKESGVVKSRIKEVVNSVNKRR